LRTILVVYLINKVIYLRPDARKLMFLIACTGHTSKDDIGARDRAGYYMFSSIEHIILNIEY